MEFSSITKPPGTSPRDQEHEDEARSERWLLSYADLVTTLMVFFLALYILQLAKTKESEMKAAAAQAVPVAMAPPVAQPDLTRRARLVALLAPLVERREVTVKETPQGIEIAINARILFNSGEARLLPDGLDDLARVAEVLKKGSPRSILVEGHTDSAPIATAQYASNWELSAARAGAVVRFLVERGIEPGRLAAIGRADNDPLALGDDAVARAANRRVTIVAQY